MRASGASGAHRVLPLMCGTQIPLERKRTNPIFDFDFGGGEKGASEHER